VLKIPKADALASATDEEREGILASFVEEARALAGLYHPNVANIIDRGVSDGVPFLVLEYLIGADLKQYSSARLMSLFELRRWCRVVRGPRGAARRGPGAPRHQAREPLAALPLAGGERFDPQKHRDPAHAAARDGGHRLRHGARDRGCRPRPCGRFVAGTAGLHRARAGLDPVELDGRADVYALAGTIYNVTTGRTFFDDIDNPRDASSRTCAAIRSRTPSG
jgi:hypothetical protein